MAVITSDNLAALTVTYNGVQFGGGDSDHSSVPPTYSLIGTFVYDQGGIAVKHTEYVLSVKTIFYNSSEALMSQAANDLKLKLAQPGKELKIIGIGIGFGTIDHDEEWGPKPQHFEWQPIGNIAWECIWTVKFCVKHCTGVSSSSRGVVFTSFNFETSWTNDIEGLTTRTIAGHVEIVGKRKAVGQNIPAHIADEVREKVKIIVPNGFRRVTNIWREGVQKNQLQFVIVDQVLPGTAPPQGCISAEGSCAFSTQGPGFVKGAVSISMDIKTSPSVAPSLAGNIFLTAALTKQQQMTAANPGGTVIPVSFSIVNRKYDGARITSATMSWSTSYCITSLMKVAKIWEPLTPNNYQQWRTSVENLWDNRGSAIINGGKIGNDPREAVIIDLCQNTSSIQFGSSSISDNTYENNRPLQFTCPDIPLDGGWLFHEVKIEVLRNTNLQSHRKAIPYLPDPVTALPVNSQGSTLVDLGSPSYTQSSDSEKNDIEFNGLPEMYVALRFRCLRVKHKPSLPIISQIGGNVPIEVQARFQAPNPEFDTANCPVWSATGYRIYRVNGPISAVGATSSYTDCATLLNGGKTNYDT